MIIFPRLANKTAVAIAGEVGHARTRFATPPRHDVTDKQKPHCCVRSYVHVSFRICR